MVESSWNVMAHGDAREGEMKGNLANGVGSQYTSHYLGTWCIQHYTADVHTAAASSRLNWRPRRLKWTRPFRRKTKSGFCVCAITFQRQASLYGCFGTTYRSHLQGSSSPNSCSAWLFKIGSKVCPETSVRSQKTACLIYTATEAWNHVKVKLSQSTSWKCREV
jgi:hypothetical protein